MGTFNFTDSQINDGAQKYYFQYSTLNFEQVTVPIQFGYDRSLEVYYVAPAGAADPLHTGDWLLSNKFILTAQNDYFEIGLELPVAEVWGGNGNDTLITDDDTQGSSLYGGAGDDLLVSHFQVHSGRNHLLGGDGNDTLISAGNDEMSGGAGTDHFVLSSGTGSAFLTDLTPGAESVDIWRVLSNQRDYYLTFSDAVADGTMRVAYQNGYTYVYYNAGGPTPEQLLTYIKGTVRPDQYDSTFITNFAQSYDNRPGLYAKVLDGTANPARDHLVGGPGKDVIIMGDTDEGTANGGYDRFVLTNLTGASAFITDIQDQIGNVIELNVVDMAKPLYEAGYSYSSFSEAQAAGTLGIAYDHGYTHLYYDADGDHVAEHEFAHIKGISLAQVDNIYLVAPAQSYFDLTGVA
jgi:Ca2+-binding RTX toxin-like protein